MGTGDRSPTTRSIILDPGASRNIMAITPPIECFDGYENNSGHGDNMWVQAPHAPCQSRRTHNSNSSMSATPIPPLGDQTHLVVPWQSFDDGGVVPETPEVDDAPTHTTHDLVTLATRLTVARQLYDAGALSQDEYEAKRAEILALV